MMENVSKQLIKLKTKTQNRRKINNLSKKMKLPFSGTFLKTIFQLVRTPIQVAHEKMSEYTEAAMNVLYIV